ncbi:MAG TPA: diaminopimelate epimerase [Kofleriaceae bacterium]|jgi:diaminopimelate epimerase|nr:diaminopimelate epimerase [Kofleriaceae bacterium]
MTLGPHQFVRSHGAGNDYLVVDGARLGFALTAERIRRICDRHTGVGSDGILELTAPPPDFDAAVRIHNPDGSEAEKSGNGVRIFAKFCLDHGYVAGDRPIRIHTLGGAVEATLVAREQNRTVLRVAMGRVSFRCADLPMTTVEAEWVQRPLEVGDRAFTATCLSVGNPHAVLLDAPFDEATARTYGPLVENHPLFPRRTNVQLVQPVDRSTVKALIWERGAGWTLSSGSSACAVAAACVRAGLTDRAVTVVMPGGTLEVQVHEDWRIEQTGFAQEVAIGQLGKDLLADLGV